MQDVLFHVKLVPDLNKKGRESKKLVIDKKHGSNTSSLFPNFLDYFFSRFFAIFRGQTHNKYGAYLFRAFLLTKTALPEVCADRLFKMTWINWL